MDPLGMRLQQPAGEEQVEMVMLLLLLLLLLLHLQQIDHRLKSPSY